MYLEVNQYRANNHRECSNKLHSATAYGGPQSGLTALRWDDGLAPLLTDQTKSYHNETAEISLAPIRDRSLPAIQFNHKYLEFTQILISTPLATATASVGSQE